MNTLSLLQFTEGATGPDLVANTERLEALGYETLWLPEVIGGREPVAACAYLLGRTSRLRVATGILNVYARDAHAAAQTRQTLAELSGGRFTLGLGVSHPVLVEPRGHVWEAPVKRMSRFLDELDAAPAQEAATVPRAPVVIAGHGPRLMRLAAQRADGLFLYLQPLEQVARARAVLGPERELHVVVRTVLCPDAAKARAVARQALGFYIGLPAYHRAWQSAGFTAADYADGGSDRLLDAIAPWGDAATLRTRLAAYVEAGASHVCLYPIDPTDDYRPDRAGGLKWDWATLEALAPAGG